MLQQLWFRFHAMIDKIFYIVIRYAAATFDRSYFIYDLIPELSVETTNVCLSKCVFCANHVMKRQREHLDMELFMKAVDQFVGMGGTELYFNTVIGDPLCDPYLLERARFVHQYPQIKSLGFVTNLQLFHKYNTDDFFDSGIHWLTISIVLSGKDKYREFFAVDVYEQTLSNLVALLKANTKYHRKIDIVIEIKPTNEKVAAIIHHPDFQLVSSLTQQDLAASVKAASFFVDDWLGAVRLPRYLKKRPLFPRFFRPCQALRRAAVIFSNGTVGACSCRDFNADSELVLGSLRETNIRELLQGEKRGKLFSDWLNLNKVPAVCRKCSSYLY